MEKFSDIKYERVDFKKVKYDINVLFQNLKKDKTYEDFRKDYVGINKIIESIETTFVICDIRNTLDKNDKFYEEERNYLMTNYVKLAVSSKKINKFIVNSKFRQNLINEFGEMAIKKQENKIRLMSVWSLPYTIKEDKLSQEYSKAAALCKTNFRGEECNFYGLLKHMQSTDRDERKEAFEAWAKLYEEVSPKLDEIYDKLVKVRVKKARSLGFKNYIDYIYLDRERFDYNAEDAAKFREQVRKVIVPLCNELYEKQSKRLNLDKLRFYDESLVFPEGNAMPIGGEEELVEKARKMYEEMSPETGEFFNYLKEHGLYDLTTRPGKHLGGYTTFLEGCKAPFIFSNFNGTSADVDVLTHEAGHAFAGYLSLRNNMITDTYYSTSEINEIHSMSMEHFAYPWMESFFGDKVDKYKYAHLVDSLKTIPYLVSVDEFQHRVFENPKMTAMERRKVWKDIENKYMPTRDYDGNEFLEGGGFWMQKQHIFLYPFYYIDYALAQVCAYQYFIRIRENKEQTWESYLTLCKRGGSKGYFDLLKEAKLDNPFSEGTVEKVANEIKKIIDEFESKI